MIMTNQGYNSYKKVERMTGSTRLQEARVLTEAALRLEKCLDDWGGDGHKDRLFDALRYNQKVWSVLQVALLAEDCPLPENMRVNLLRVSSFITKQIFRAMARPQLELLRPIIEINIGLAKGLRAKPSQPVEPPRKSHEQAWFARRLFGFIRVHWAKGRGARVWDGISGSF